MYDSVWYNNLKKPFLSPPNWIFPWVWSFLYFLIFISLVLFIVKKSDSGKLLGYTYFVLQMLMNFSWSFAFFGAKNITLALIIVLLLDLFLILTIREFYSISELSAYLLLPYLIWVLFATYLNASYLLKNMSL